MSTTYSVVSGDTFASVARKQYGDDGQAGQVRSANPGAVEPLQPGTTLVIPDLPGAPRDAPQNAASNTPDEVSVSIDGERFRFWESVTITRAFDSPDSIELSGPYEPDRPEFREAFRPLSYKPIEVAVGGAPLFTGTAVGNLPGLGIDRRTVSLSGYATPGVMADCPPAASTYPLEFNGQNLQQIAEALARPFGVAVVFEAAPGPTFDRVACESTEKALEFLTELAKQRNLVIGSTPRGALLFRDSAGSGAPVATLSQGESPAGEVTPSFKPQEYYSTITGIEPVIVGLRGGQYTVRNPRLTGVTRPYTFKVDDANGGDLKTAVEAKAARMFANVVAYTVPLDTWRDPSGALWTPGTFVSLIAPGVFIFNPYTFLIRRVTLTRTGDSTTAELGLVLPGVFNGRIPGSLPWD